jgi:hypothetical protein
MTRTSNAPRVALVAALLAAPMSGAQPEAPSHVEAFVRMRQAAVARGRNDLIESARLYREALEMGAPPQCLRDLATVLEAQSRWREAAGLWTRYSALANTEAERRAALERRDLAFERTLRGVHDAGVDVAEGAQREEVGGVLHVVEDEGRGLVDRRDARARGRIGRGARVERQRVEARCSVGHSHPPKN